MLLKIASFALVLFGIFGLVFEWIMKRRPEPDTDLEMVGAFPDKLFWVFQPKRDITFTLATGAWIIVEFKETTVDARSSDHKFISVRYDSGYKLYFSAFRDRVYFKAGKQFYPLLTN